MNIAIFDLDGTIADTIEDIHFALMETLTHFNFDTFDQSITTSYVGDGIKALLERSVGQNHYSSTIDTYFRKIYRENIVKKSCLFDGIQTMLSTLPKLMDISVILSNKSTDLTTLIVNHFRLDQYFNTWYGGDSFNEKKPSPMPIQGILDRYGILPKNAIIVGDNHTDIDAGFSAGITTCFCEYGYGSLAKIAPTYSIPKPKDIIHILEKFNA